MKYEDKLSDLVEKVIPSLLSNLIFDTDEGHYVLFNQYYIQKINSYYECHKYSDDTKQLFSSLKNATTWSILDKYNKIYEARRVIELDSLMAGVNVDKAIHKKLKSTGNLENREINRDKLLFDLMKQNRFQHELDKYIILAKTCQQRGFENELTRTSGK